MCKLCKKLKFRYKQGFLSIKTYENYKRTLEIMAKNSTTFDIDKLETKMRRTKGISLSFIRLIKGAIKHFSSETEEYTNLFLSNIDKLEKSTTRSEPQKKEPIMLKDLDILENKLFDPLLSVSWSDEVRTKLFSHMILSFYTAMRSIELSKVKYIGEKEVNISDGTKKLRIEVRATETKTKNQEETYFLNIINEKHKGLILSLDYENMYTHSSYRVMLNKFFKKIGYTNKSTHSFRVGFISQALASKNDIKLIQTVTKHKCVKTLLNYDRRMLDNDYVELG